MIQKDLKKLIKIIIKLTKRPMKYSRVKLYSSGYYSSRLGVNLYLLPTGEYNLVYELYLPSSSIDSSTVQISAASSVERIFKVATNAFSDHSRPYL